MLCMSMQNGEMQNDHILLHRNKTERYQIYISLGKALYLQSTGYAMLIIWNVTYTK